jgi:hypothetical protein
MRKIVKFINDCSIEMTRNYHFDLGKPFELGYLEKDICFQYSENKDLLLEVLKDTTISCTLIGFQKYFDDDKDPRYVLSINILRNNKTLNFTFGMSYFDTQILMKKTEKTSKVKDDLLYNILCSCKADYYCPDTFEDFCNEYGYDTDSRKAEQIYHALSKQSKELQKIFTETEIESFPS